MPGPALASSKGRAARELALFVGLAAVLTGVFRFGFNHAERARLEAIDRAPVVLEGIVTATNCGDHARVSYRYTAGGASRLGSDRSQGECSPALNGSQLKVWTSEQTPGSSTLQDPRDQLASMALIEAFGGVTSAFAIIASWRWRFGRRAQGKPTQA